MQFRSINSGIMTNVDVSVKNVMQVKKIIFGIFLHVIPTNFCKMQNFNILLAFLLITIALLIAASIYCYFIKYQEIQKHLLTFHVTNNELREVLY